MSPEQVNEQFTYLDCLKINAILDMKQDLKLYELGVSILKTPKINK